MSNSFQSEPQESGATKDEKAMGLLAHLLGIIGVIGPLIIWLIKKDSSPFVEDQAKESLNFQITVLIVWAAAGVLSFAHLGFIMPLIPIANLVFCIIAAMKANEGIKYRYPFALRLIS